MLGVGYDLHITRAFMSFESDRYPILGAEVDELIRTEADLVVPPDAPRRPEFCYLTWHGDDWLLFDAGRLRTTHPRPALARRMTELAARLDAWLIGDDGEVYEWDGERVASWQRGVEAFAANPRHLTRGTASSGLNAHAPITREEWEQFVATQPDFAMMTRIEATLPSGVRPIPCPPVACWMGHPSGRPVPFFHDRDVIEVRDADEPTARRMATLAPQLGARAV